jgi:hypothetical protein
MSKQTLTKNKADLTDGTEKSYSIIPLKQVIEIM